MNEDKPEYPPEFTMPNKVWDDTVVVTEIMARRHKAKFPEEDSPSTLSFCNNCGGMMIRRFKNDEKIPVCAGCNWEMPELLKELAKNENP